MAAAKKTTPLGRHEVPGETDGPQAALNCAEKGLGFDALRNWIARDPQGVARLFCHDGRSALRFCMDKLLAIQVANLAPFSSLDGLDGVDLEPLFRSAMRNFYIAGMLNGLGGSSMAKESAPKRAGDLRAIAELMAALGQEAIAINLLMRALREEKRQPNEDALVCALWNILPEKNRREVWQRRTPADLPNAHACQERDALAASLNMGSTDSSAKRPPRSL